MAATSKRVQKDDCAFPLLKLTLALQERQRFIVPSNFVGHHAHQPLVDRHVVHDGTKTFRDRQRLFDGVLLSGAPRWSTVVSKQFRQHAEDELCVPPRW